MGTHEEGPLLLVCPLCGWEKERDHFLRPNNEIEGNTRGCPPVPYCYTCEIRLMGQARGRCAPYYTAIASIETREKECYRSWINRRNHPLNEELVEMMRSLAGVSRRGEWKREKRYRGPRPSEEPKD